MQTNSPGNCTQDWLLKSSPEPNRFKFNSSTSFKISSRNNQFMSRSRKFTNTLRIPLFCLLFLLIVIPCSCVVKKAPHFSRAKRSTDINVTSLDPILRAKQLRHDLLTPYTKIIRPRLDQSKPVNVYFDVKIRQLVTVDIRTSEVTLMICLWQMWTDDNLKWNDTFYGGRYIRMDPNEIWIPDVIFTNSINEFEHLKEITALPLRVNWYGSVLWQLPILKKTRCLMDVRYFPYDIQTCYLELGSWIMLTHQVNLELLDNKRGRDKKELEDFHHPEWSLIQIQKLRLVQGIPGYETSVLRFQYSFQRQAKYFEYTMIYPTVLISVMAFISFNLPNGCGEKISLSVMILLALVLNLCMIGRYTPHSNNEIPIMGEFFFGGIVLVGVAVMQSVGIMLMHHCTETPSPPPPILKRVVLQYLAKVTLVSTAGLDLEGDEDLRTPKPSLFNVLADHERACKSGDEGKDRHESTENSEPTRQTTIIGYLFSSAVAHLETSAKLWLTVECQQEEYDRNKLEWELIATVLDRILMMGFIILCIACGLVFKLKIYTGEEAVLGKLESSVDVPDYDYYYYYYDH